MYNDVSERTSLWKSWHFTGFERVSSKANIYFRSTGGDGPRQTREKTQREQLFFRHVPIRFHCLALSKKSGLMSKRKLGERLNEICNHPPQRFVHSSPGFRSVSVDFGLISTSWNRSVREEINPPLDTNSDMFNQSEKRVTVIKRLTSKFTSNS